MCCYWHLFVAQVEISRDMTHTQLYAHYFQHGSAKWVEVVTFLKETESPAIEV